MSGLKLAALYSLKPHLLGLCGPREAAKQKILFKYLAGEDISSKKIREVLKKFTGAYSYYQLIAKSNKINDPFDEEVIRAYWLGNELLNRIKITDLRKIIAKDFSRPGLLPKNAVLKKSKEIPKGSGPHHSFHVLVIGSVTGSINFANTKLKDLCRIGWGKIIKRLQVTSFKFKVLVEYQPLVGKKILKLGKLRKKEVIWDKKIVPEVKIGDWVSFHWDQLVQVLTKEDLANLKKYTLNTLNSLR